MNKSGRAKLAIGEKGNEVIQSLAHAMETCKLSIHVRFIFCNLNEISVRKLADSLVKNSSFIGFTCLFHPCMVENRSDGCWYHSLISSAAQYVRAAVIKSHAPLQIWNNQKIVDDIFIERQRFTASTASSSSYRPISSRNTLNQESEVDQMTKKLKELKKSTESKLFREIQVKLKQRESKLVQLALLEKDVSADLDKMKELALLARKELQEHEAQLKQTQAKFRTLQEQITKKTQYLTQVHTEITENKMAVDDLKVGLGRISSENDHQGKSDIKQVREESPEFMKEKLELEIICSICNERQKDVVIQCGHRLCKTCLDEWKKKNNVCPFCKSTIQNVIRFFN